MIVAGERRFRAFVLLERSTIPAIMSEGGTDELALIENIQREDLTPVDEYEAVAHLIDKHGYSQSDAARVLGKSRVSINELMSLRTLAAPILDEAHIAKISKSTLIEVARAKGEGAQRDLWATVRGGYGTVRTTRQAKHVIGNSAAKQSPIGTALRAGRRFLEILSKVPPSSDAGLSEMLALADRLAELLDALGNAQE